MATRSGGKELENGIQVALDAADTASGVTEEFNNVREQFEVVNIQAKRIYQSVLIIFVSAIVAAIISLGAGLLMYYKALGTLRTNSNMAIESLAIFTENVSTLDKSVKTVETNTANQEIIKNSLGDIRSAAEKASKDIAAAERKYNQAIKLSVQDTERVIKEFAETTLVDLKTQSDLDFDEAGGGFAAGQSQDFEQNGLLLKIATDGISIQDYVKRLKESDILVAVDGELFLEGPAELENRFRIEEGDEPKWLLTFYRDGQLFDILLRAPIQSQFGLATEQETKWALEQFKTHLYGEFSEYQNFEVYRNGSYICDILSIEKDPVAFILPSLWCLKYRLYPPLAALLAAYLTTFFINIFLFVLTYLILSRFVYISQENILRSFTLYAGKNHYMTIASTNENDVSAIVKKIDPKNKIRFERNAIRRPTVVHKVIVKGATTPGE